MACRRHVSTAGCNAERYTKAPRELRLNGVAKEASRRYQNLIHVEIQQANK